MHYENARLPDASAAQQFSWQAGAGTDLNNTVVRDEVNAHWIFLIQVRGGVVFFMNAGIFGECRHIWGMQQKELLGDGEE
ncbi:hypothetical protein Ancab_028526 [Ancistrocladus abbreviatus]